MTVPVQSQAAKIAASRFAYAQKDLSASLLELATLATHQARAENLGHLLRQVAVAEGRLSVAREVHLATEGGASPEEVKQMMTDIVLRGADDGWSGRGNDLKRSLHEGVLAEAKKVLR